MSSKSVDNDWSPFVLASVFIIGVGCTAGVIANGFIVAIYVATWIQKKTLSTSGRILVFLSVSRIVLNSLMILEISLVSTFSLTFFKDRFYTLFKISFIFLHYCGLWFPAWLSFFYFMKIANFSSSLFLKLKWRISGWIPRLLWLSVLISFSCSLVFCKDTITLFNDDSHGIRFHNSTKGLSHIKTNMTIVALFISLSILVPLIIFIVAATMLIISLKRHTLHMKSRATGSRDPRMEAHIGAIKATSYFLILYFFNAVTLFLAISDIFKNSSFWTILLRISLITYPTAHSVLLIQDNPGLKRAWRKLQSQIHLHPGEWILR
ncbi:taste receptor type 2 member 39 [Perognathus longimembris pacificus]|uniref:taste receptor type 2 member 39 n=1 Tax=Perognathus longimembris pacificus TaxID=214514 RepID=UPI002018E047|nr:taste receptor type 2 member 39 [Perognathus longimembris pacificus]